jgi:hypothetical protein
MNAPRAQEAGAYPRDEAVAPVTRYRARQDIANSDYLGAAMDGDDTDDSSNNGGNNDGSNNGNGNGGGNGGGSPYGGGGGSGGGSGYAPYPTTSFSGTVNGAYGGGGGKHKGMTDPTGCVYKGVMTDAEIATCKAASIAEMRHNGVR